MFSFKDNFLVSDNDMDKDRWVVGYDNKDWLEFVGLYLERLKDFLLHRYERDWQNHCRDRIANVDFNGNIHLKPKVLFSSMDFIQSIRLKPKTLTHATQTSHYEVQLLAFYDIQNVNGILQKRGYYYLSDNPHHNWSSAVVGYDHYLKKRKQNFLANGTELRVHTLWSDRGPSDQWCAPFLAYAHDIAKRENVLLNQNTSGTNHGKWNHDRIGGNVGRCFGTAYREGKYVIVRGESPAEKTVDWLRANCEWTHDEKGNRVMQQFFFVIPPAAIKCAKSPVKTLSIGIKDYHCMVSHQHKTYFRRYSCSCNACLNTDWGACQRLGYCGQFQRAFFTPYVQYDAIESKYDDDGNRKKKRRKGSE